MRVLFLLAAASFAIYEAALCTYHVEGVTEQVRGLSEDLKKQDEAIAQWSTQQERIHDEQMALIQRLAEVSREAQPSEGRASDPTGPREASPGRRATRQAP